MVLHVVHITTLQSLIVEITGLSQQQAKISKDLFVALLFGLKMTSSVCLVSRVDGGRGWITGVHLGFESPVCVCFKCNATPPQNLDIHLQTSPYKGRTDFRSSEQTERSLAILKQKFRYIVTGARQTHTTPPSKLLDERCMNAWHSEVLHLNNFY